jgi:galactokinase
MKAINDAHFQEYEVKPEIVSTAPGRFHLIGEHSWFFKDQTLSMAINIPVYVSVSNSVKDVNGVGVTPAIEELTI